MKPRLALLLAALAAGAAGCARDNDASVTMRAVCFPTDDCTFAETCDAQFIGFPTLDLAVSNRLWLFLEVGNQLPNNADETIGRTNTNDALVTAFQVDYERVAAPRVHLGMAQSVPANGSAVISVEAVPPEPAVTAALQAVAPTAAGVEVIAKVRLLGRYTSGEDFETGEFPIAVRVCTGCLGLQCGGAPTCPPASEGQLPLVCGEAAPAAPVP